MLMLFTSSSQPAPPTPGGWSSQQTFLNCFSENWLEAEAILHLPQLFCLQGRPGTGLVCVRDVGERVAQHD